MACQDFFCGNDAFYIVSDIVWKGGKFCGNGGCHLITAAESYYIIA
jgi:hypothetical protein